MKKSFILLAVAGIITLGSCTKNEVEITPTVQEITISEKKDLTLQIGQTSQEIIVMGGDNENFKIVSSQPSVAEVQQNKNKFTIKALQEGDAVISISSVGKTKELSVKVSKILIEKIEVVEAENYQAGNASIFFKIYPENATNKELVWESSNKDIVKIADAKKGEIFVMNKPGKSSVITIKSKDGSNVSVQHTVNVVQLVRQIDLDVRENLSLAVGTTFKLNYVISPVNATNKNVSWQSSNPDVVSVDSEGNITTLKGGIARITVTANDGSETSSSVEVKSVLGINKITIDTAVNDEIRVKKMSKTPLSITTWSNDKQVESGITKKSQKSETATVRWKTADGYYFGKERDNAEHIFDAYKSGSVKVTATYYDTLENEYVEKEVTIIVEQ